MIELGKTYLCKITGFRGVATGRVEYLTGCNQALLAPACGDDGTFKESQWLDEQRLIECRDAQRITLENGQTPGSDRAAPKR